MKICDKHKVHSNYDGSWLFNISYSNKIDFGHYSIGINHIISDSVISSSPDQWYQIGISYDDLNDIYNFYCNGNNVMNGTADIEILDNDKPLYFGCSLLQSGQPGAFSNIIMDEVRIYNRVLSDIEINSLYHEGGWPLK